MQVGLFIPCYIDAFPGSGLEVLSQHLVVLLDPTAIVSNMHDAYRRIDLAGSLYGVFLVARHRAYFRSGATRSADWRESQLTALRAMMIDRAEHMFAALWTDLLLKRTVVDCFWSCSGRPVSLSRSFAAPRARTT
jgi:hypothetical protein